jgi:hypothetical protein
MAKLLENPLGSGLGLATIGARHFTEFSQLVFTESYLGISRSKPASRGS